jgi:hypothetical protein
VWAVVVWEAAPVREVAVVEETELEAAPVAVAAAETAMAGEEEQAVAL